MKKKLIAQAVEAALSAPQVLIIDLGSQLTLVIARTIEELGVRCKTLYPEKAADWLAHNKPKAIIASGSDSSVDDADAPQIPEAALTAGVPILGICYAMQWLAKYFGGKVTKHRGNKGYGEAQMYLSDYDNAFFQSLKPRETVWESHGDSVTALPKGFRAIASFEGTQAIAAMCDPDREIWGTQFHPEVPHTVRGKVMLSNFLFDIAGCRKDWSEQDVIENIRKKMRALPKNAKCPSSLSAAGWTRRHWQR